MMRLEVRIVFWHKEFPSEQELAVGESLNRSLYLKTKGLVSGIAEGTDFGSVYVQFELLKRDHQKVMRIVREVLRELSLEDLAKITEQRPLSTYKVATPDFRRRSPMKDALPPTYLSGNARLSSRKGPAKLLFSGRWCGHGRETFMVLDIVSDKDTSFRVRLPESDDKELNPPVVLCSGQSKEITAYDSREHKASIYSEKYRHLEPRLKGHFHCPKCGKDAFHLAVGFEVPDDSEGPNDTSWFALAAECVKCGWLDLIYDDETQ
jgi:hypothetical protein